MATGLYILISFAGIGLMSVVLHEYAHAKVANLCGDYTAEAAGRLTLNPLKHIDFFMTILLPALLILSGTGVIFAGAKPVPINPYNLRHLRRDNRLVSLAGVSTNLVLACLLAACLHALLASGIFYADPVSGRISPGAVVLGMAVRLNLVLCVFNCFPLPPLDGSRVLRSFLPPHLEAIFDRLDHFGLLLLFGFLWVFPQAVGIVVGFLWQRLLFLPPYLGYMVRIDFAKAVQSLF